VKQTNLELERRDGVKRHFRYDWEEIARYIPDYRAYVRGEKERLGEDHPLFLTQYRLLPITGGEAF
jgi:Mlc titration factor MtfA (ptsG expression regulator)